MSRVTLPRSGWDKENVATVRSLEALGWEFHRNGGGQAVHGRSPDGADTVSIHSRSGNRKKYEALVRKWSKTTPAEKFVTVAEAMSDPATEAVDPVIDAVLLAAADKHLAAAASVVPARVVVSERPWLSRMGSSREKATTDLVENERVTEVTYSDGAVEYRCEHPGCEFTAVKPRSVAAHFGQAHTKTGAAAPRDAAARVPVAVDVPIDTATMRQHHYNPTERLTRALVAFLEGSGATDPSGFAYAALQWFHSRPDLVPVEAREHRDLTAEEILDRVRLLVGGRDVALESEHTEALRTIERMTHEARGYLDVIAEGQRKVESLEADIEAWIALAPRKP